MTTPIMTPLWHARTGITLGTLVVMQLGNAAWRLLRADPTGPAYLAGTAAALTAIYALTTGMPRRAVAPGVLAVAALLADWVVVLAGNDGCPPSAVPGGVAVPVVFDEPELGVDR